MRNFFPAGEFRCHILGKKKNAKVWDHDFVARTLVQNFFLTSKDQVCLYYSLTFFLVGNANQEKESAFLKLKF
jgi:hypothetical protein